MPKNKKSTRKKPTKAQIKKIKKLHDSSVAIAKDRAKENLPDLVNVSEAAEMLGLTPRRVRDFLLSGRLPAMRFARMWMIKKVDVLNFAQMPRRSGKPRNAS